MLQPRRTRPDPRPTPTRLRSLGARLAAGVALSAAVAATSGCNIAGPAFYFVHGPEKIPAQYELPADKKVVVFIDDRENILRDRSMRQAIAKSAEQRLLEGGAVPKGEVISSDGIAAVTAADRWGKPLGIAQVGEAVGADVVVYATIDAFALSNDGASLAPNGRLRIKVVDSASRKRLWPGEDQEWGQVTTVVPRRDGTLPTSSSAFAAEETRLAQRMGNDLANVFLRHEAKPRENEIGR